jgi:phosphoenolpyruvate-protein kinase (PTS system EI component)
MLEHDSRRCLATMQLAAIFASYQEGSRVLLPMVDTVSIADALCKVKHSTSMTTNLKRHH